MKYSQNEKILQITDHTLIVGVDVGSETHYARAFDYRGIELGKVYKFANSHQGFVSFSQWIKELQDKYQKSYIMTGMEPTGQYWFNIAQYLNNDNVRIVLVNPGHVKKIKELDDNNPTKNDRKDPKTIAKLVKDGRYLIPYIPEGLYMEIRILMENRWGIVKQLNAIRNRMKRWISIYFPEFNNVFSSWEGKAALIVLKEFPTPAEVLEKGIDGIIARWKENKLRGIGRTRAIALVEAAKTSIGLKYSLLAAKNDVTIIIEDYEMKLRQLERTMNIVEQLIRQISGIEELTKIKGVGLVTAAGFVAEVGDINRFDHPKQIQKLAGLNLKENSSGKYKGQTTITKRGRKRLRAILFLCAKSLVKNAWEYRQLHKYYTTRQDNPLKKMESLTAICCKVIRVFYAILTKKIAYDPHKMLSDIKRPPLVSAA